MKSTMKTVFFSLATVAAMLVSGCGSSGGGTASDSGAAATSAATSSNSPSAVSSDGAALYAANCAGCHGALATSAKKGAAASDIQLRMYKSPYATRTLTPAEVQAIADALAVTPSTTTSPPPPATPVCGSCHAIPPASGEHAFHTSRRIACATCHGSGYSTTTVNAATHNNGVKNLTTTIGWNAANRSCSNSCHGNNSW